MRSYSSMASRTAGLGAVLLIFCAALIISTTTLLKDSPFSYVDRILPYRIPITQNVSVPVSRYGFTRSRPWTVLTYSNAGFLDFMDNWLISVHRLGIRDHITVAAKDSISYQHTIKRWGKEMSIDVVNASVTPSKFLPFGDPEYFKLINSKPHLILRFLEQGLDVLFTDLDMVWLQNPLDYIPEGYDLHLMEEEHPEPYEQRGSRINICTCLMYWQSNNRTLALVREWVDMVDKSTKPSDNEQIAFNGLIRSSKTAPQLRMNVLDFRKFVSGKYYFVPEWRERHSPIKPAVVHNNFIVGHDTKMRRFKDVGLWYL